MGRFDIDKVTEELFKNTCFTRDLPDPDLLIRPSGEPRISNFAGKLPILNCGFQIYWPDFTEEHLFQAICDYQQRDRRFGGLKNKAVNLCLQKV